MKKFKYEQYDYAFLYSLLAESQRESLQSVLSRFIGYPNTEATICNMLLGKLILLKMLAAANTSEYTLVFKHLPN